MTNHLRSDSAHLARHAVLAIFAINGLALSAWFPHIPAVQRRLALSDGTLGLALLGVPIGAMLAIPLCGALLARFGSRRVTLAAALLLRAALPLPGLAPGRASLMIVLALLGGANGAFDVAMNARAVIVERQYRRPTMASFHGASALAR